MCCMALTSGLLFAHAIELWSYSAVGGLACNSPLLPGVLVPLGFRRCQQHLGHLVDQLVPYDPSRLSHPEVFEGHCRSTISKFMTSDI